MAAPVSLDELIQKLAANSRSNLFKASASAKAAGTFQDLFLTAGLPGAGIAPTTAAGAACDASTSGAIPVTPATPLWLARLALSGATVGTLILYDRLVHTATLNGTLTTAQTVGSVALPRYTDGVGVEMFIETYTATGGTASNATISYTNQAGTAGKSTTVAMQATPVAGQLVPVPLAAGDTGVRSVQTVTLSASTATAGNFGITLLRKLAEIPLTAANVGQVLDALALGLPALGSSPCLALMVLASATNTGVITGSLDTVA